LNGSLAPYTLIAATKNKSLKMNHLTVHGEGNTVTYGNRQYSIQNDRGHLHIVVRENGRRKKITVKRSESDCVFDYIFGGGSVTHPCPAMDYWIMRWRMKRKISVQQFKQQYLNYTYGKEKCNADD